MHSFLIKSKLLLFLILNIPNVKIFTRRCCECPLLMNILFLKYHKVKMEPEAPCYKNSSLGGWINKDLTLQTSTLSTFLYVADFY